jgi:hypothetical protein
MSNGSNGIPEEQRPDAFAEWRRLLRHPEAIPGQELADKDAAWDKLFDRLGEKPRRRFFGYRIAAACILILLIPAARLFQHQPGSKDRPASARIRPVVVQPVPVRPAAAAANLAQAQPATQPNASHAGPQSGNKDRSAPARIKPAGSPGAAHSNSAQPGLARQDQVRPDPAQPIIVAPPRLAATTPPPVLPPPQKPKKQWKVVDINELDPGRPRPHVMADNRQPPLLRLGLGIPNTTDNSRDNDTRLKINLSTQNR